MSLKMEAANLKEVQERIRSHEGFELDPYVDSLGFLIGWSILELFTKWVRAGFSTARNDLQTAVTKSCIGNPS